MADYAQVRKEHLKIVRPCKWCGKQTAKEYQTSESNRRFFACSDSHAREYVRKIP